MDVHRLCASSLDTQVGNEVSFPECRFHLWLDHFRGYLPSQPKGDAPMSMSGASRSMSVPENRGELESERAVPRDAMTMFMFHLGSDWTA